jgi:hypothetical protein
MALLAPGGLELLPQAAIVVATNTTRSARYATRMIHLPFQVQMSCGLVLRIIPPIS